MLYKKAYYIWSGVRVEGVIIVGDVIILALYIMPIYKEGKISLKVIR